MVTKLREVGHEAEPLLVAAGQAVLDAIIIRRSKSNHRQSDYDQRKS